MLNALMLMLNELMLMLIRLLHPQHLHGIWIGQNQYRLPLAPLNTAFIGGRKANLSRFRRSFPEKVGIKTITVN